ncbi:MAG: DoxX family protein [Sphingomicrobium sp.]
MSGRQADIALLVARLLMASLFLWSGIEKIFDMHGAADFAASAGIPFALQLMPLAILLELGCAVALIIGWQTRVAAIALALWMIILGPLFHQFWSVPPDRWQESIDGFFHHLVMIGGMIYVAVFGPGGLAVEARRNAR